MKNDYFQNLNKIEFVITMACTGKCIHCQNGDPVRTAAHIDAEAAISSIQQICLHYPISTVMTFGGEPLLFPQIVCQIHQAARSCGISNRQVITNGFFSNDPKRIDAVVRGLVLSGVNDLLLSVDAFHQKTIPLEPVLFFAECAVKYGLPIRLSPAWLVSSEDDNPYNLKTRKILQEFAFLSIPVSEGNVIFPFGNALKYLREYFPQDIDASSPYEEDPYDIRTLSFSADGEVLNGNVNHTDILEILRSYTP